MDNESYISQTGRPFLIDIETNIYNKEELNGNNHIDKSDI